jgi:hypothetical protein
MKLLPLISPRVKEILAQGICSGMERSIHEVSENKVYDVGIGIDIKQRYIHAGVDYSLKTTILAAKEPTLSVGTDEHSTGHFLQITYGRFIIFPKRVDFKNPDQEQDAVYHKKLIENNPTRQGELFDINDPDNHVLVQLLFGQNKKGFFAFLNIPDSSGGVYEKEELKLQTSANLAPEEKVRTRKNLSIRSTKVSGQ